MFMLRQTSVKMAVLLHKQASDPFDSLLTVNTLVSTFIGNFFKRNIFKKVNIFCQLSGLFLKIVL